MDFHHLRYFVEIVSCQSYTKAAEQLFITQPTLTRAINQLEEEFGTQLLVRRGKNFKLTDTGEVMYQTATKILKEYDNLNKTFSDIHNFRTGEITFTAPSLLLAIYFPQIIDDFHTHFKDVKIACSNDSSYHALNALSEGKIDFALLSYTDIPDRYESQFIVNDYCQILVKNGHYLAQYESIGFNKLKDIPLIMINEEENISQLIMGRFKEAGVEPKIALRTSSLQIIRKMLEKEEYVAVLPSTIAKTLDGEKFRAVNISPSPSWKLGIVWEKGRYRNAVAVKFADYIESYCAEKLGVK